MKTADIAATIGYEVPGTYIALQVLARYQVVKQLPGKEPQHWESEQKWGGFAARSWRSPPQHRRPCMMGPAEVLAVLRCLRQAGVRAWVGGGWGVDALLGEQSRMHDDLDLSLDTRDRSRACAALVRAGYQVIEDQLPTRLVMRDRLGHTVDLHPVTFDVSGAGVQIGFEGPLHYPSDGFAGGVIAGEALDCFSAALQVRFHSGYVPHEKDLQDMRRLAQRTGVQLPPALRDEAGGVP